MTSLSDLTRSIAHRYDTTDTDMLTIVTAHTSQISDDPDLYDAHTGELSDAGVDVVTDAIQDALTDEMQIDSLVSELVQAQTDLTWQHERLARRDAALRAAMAEGVPVWRIMNETGLSRARIYQIRNNAR